MRVVTKGNIVPSQLVDLIGAHFQEAEYRGGIEEGFYSHAESFGWHSLGGRPAGVAAGLAQNFLLNGFALLSHFDSGWQRVDLIQFDGKGTPEEIAEKFRGEWRRGNRYGGDPEYFKYTLTSDGREKVLSIRDPRGFGAIMQAYAYLQVRHKINK